MQTEDPVIQLTRSLAPCPSQLARNPALFNPRVPVICEISDVFNINISRLSLQPSLSQLCFNASKEI